MRIGAISLVLAAFVTSACLSAAQSRADEITVTHYGSSMYGMPYTVAKAQGFFKAAGMDTPGFLTSEGGGTSVRNTLAADIPYGETATSAAIAAIKQGLPIRIVNSAVNTVGDILWVARRDDDRVKTPKDLAGLAIGFSAPKGGSDMVISEILHQAGVSATKRAVGAAGASLTALRVKGVDVTYTQEPIWSESKNDFRLVFNSADFIPQVSQTVGIVRADYLDAHPGLIRSIIEARRRGVDFIYAHPKEAAAVIGPEYNMDPAVVLSAIQTVATIKGINYWGRGDIDYAGLKTSLRILQEVGAVDDKPIDWGGVVSEAGLPEDLKSKK